MTFQFIRFKSNLSYADTRRRKNAIFIWYKIKQKGPGKIDDFVSKREFFHQEVNVLVHLEAVEVVGITLKHRELNLAEPEPGHTQKFCLVRQPSDVTMR